MEDDPILCEQENDVTWKKMLSNDQIECLDQMKKEFDDVISDITGKTILPKLSLIWGIINLVASITAHITFGFMEINQTYWNLEIITISRSPWATTVVLVQKKRDKTIEHGFSKIKSEN